MLAKDTRRSAARSPPNPRQSPGHSITSVVLAKTASASDSAGPQLPHIDPRLTPHRHPPRRTPDHAHRTPLLPTSKLTNAPPTPLCPLLPRSIVRAQSNSSQPSPSCTGGFFSHTFFY